ncbi:MAG: FAD binding domain-containing protein [Bacteroidales bacterium]|nr:FAD binding domain-containing protein [Bacteroidales bacterium]
MIQFILNNKLVKTNKSASSILLDFIRYDQHLKGTKAGCREGDCGACTVLVGSLKDEKVHYQSMASCLTPLGNVLAKHVVTVEGLNPDDLTPIQAALDEHAGTQCGFCTPGFVVSLTGHALSEHENTVKSAVNTVSGNICRCTGYKSIERAIIDIVDNLKDKPEALSLDWLIKQKYLPEYFKDIPSRLNGLKIEDQPKGSKIIGGGTDLYVQKPDETSDSDASFYLNKAEFKDIKEIDGYITVGASVTVNEMMYSEIFNKYFPKIKQWFKLISSEQIRNVGTIAGNFVNASPIGDLSIFFLALNAELFIKNSKGKERKTALKDFFKAYKILDLREGEIIEKLQFKIPKDNFKFNFEKVSKRTFLDIASVNTAVSYSLAKNIIEDIHISGGGLAPIPKYFDKTCEFLIGKELNQENLQKASNVLLSEVSPISDIRGSKDYKSLLLKQLFFVHFEE